MIDISRCCGPAVIEVVDALHAKVFGDFPTQQHASSQVFEFDILK
jgi:hypothetical protein